DQPCCMFEPHMVGLRTGQKLVFKNSAPVSHNVRFTSPAGNPSDNKTLAPGTELVVEGWKANTTPTNVKCDIHPWMEAWVRVFDHPYFAITDDKGNFEIKDAPAGKYRVVAWQPATGWVVGDKGKAPSKDGMVIEIKADGTTDLGKIKLKPEE